MRLKNTTPPGGSKMGQQPWFGRRRALSRRRRRRRPSRRRRRHFVFGLFAVQFFVKMRGGSFGRRTLGRIRVATRSKPLVDYCANDLQDLYPLQGLGALCRRPSPGAVGAFVGYSRGGYMYAAFYLRRVKKYVNAKPPIATAIHLP